MCNFVVVRARLLLVGGHLTEVSWRGCGTKPGASVSPATSRIATVGLIVSAKEVPCCSSEELFHTLPKTSSTSTTSTIKVVVTSFLRGRQLRQQHVHVQRRNSRNSISDTQSGVPPTGRYHFARFPSGELRCVPIRPGYERICTQKHTDRQWAPSKTDLERPQWRARCCALPLLSGWETVHKIAGEGAVPYGRYKNLLLITRPKEHFPPLAMNAKMRSKKVSH